MHIIVFCIYLFVLVGIFTIIGLRIIRIKEHGYTSSRLSLMTKMYFIFMIILAISGSMAILSSPPWSFWDGDDDVLPLLEY